MALFTLRRATPDLTGKGPVQGEGVLGYDRIVVLAIQPFALSTCESEGLGEWAHAGIASLYICEADGRLVRFSAEDVWHDIEAGIYERDEDNG